jgi:hypothetical protein
MNEIIKWITSELTKQPFLNEHLSNLTSMHVHLQGEILFDDVYVSAVSCTFTTPLGVKTFEDIEDIDQLIWDVYSLDSIPEVYETREFYQQVRAIRKITSYLSEHIQQKCLDYYIDHIHDYATGDIISYTIENISE